MLTLKTNWACFKTRGMCVFKEPRSPHRAIQGQNMAGALLSLGGAPNKTIVLCLAFCKSLFPKPCIVAQYATATFATVQQDR